MGIEIVVGGSDGDEIEVVDSTATEEIVPAPPG
jgi:hypothetical protein